MKKFILLWCIIFAIIITVTIAQADKPQHKITFKNDSKSTVTYYLFQVDHEIKRHPAPMALVIGTLAPGKYWEVNREQGIYFLVWMSEETAKILSKTERFTLDKQIIFVYGGP
jgi:hypothetical protein